MPASIDASGLRRSWARMATNCSRKLAASRASDLRLNFHPTALRASAGFTPWGAGWSNLRSAELVGVAQPIARCGEIGGIGCRRR